MKMNSQNELKMNSKNGFQNELENENELHEFAKEFNRENCLELILLDIIEKYNLKPLEETWEIHPVPELSGGLKTILHYKSEYSTFKVEKTWATNKNANTVIVDLKITKIQEE